MDIGTARARGIATKQVAQGVAVFVRTALFAVKRSTDRNGDIYDSSIRLLLITNTSIHCQYIPLTTNHGLFISR